MTEAHEEAAPLAPEPPSEAAEAPESLDPQSHTSAGPTAVSTYSASAQPLGTASPSAVPELWPGYLLPGWGWPQHLHLYQGPAMPGMLCRRTREGWQCLGSAPHLVPPASTRTPPGPDAHSSPGLGIPSRGSGGPGGGRAQGGAAAEQETGGTGGGCTPVPTPTPPASLRGGPQPQAKEGGQTEVLSLASGRPAPHNDPFIRLREPWAGVSSDKGGLPPPIPLVPSGGSWALSEPDPGPCGQRPREAPWSHACHGRGHGLPCTAAVARPHHTGATQRDGPDPNPAVLWVSPGAPVAHWPWRLPEAQGEEPGLCQPVPRVAEGGPREGCDNGVDVTAPHSPSWHPR